MEPYLSGTSSFGSVDATKNAPLKAAILEVDSLLGMSDFERLKRCQYVNFAKLFDRRRGRPKKFNAKGPKCVEAATKCSDYPQNNMASVKELLLAGTKVDLSKVVQSVCLAAEDFTGTLLQPSTTTSGQAFSEKNDIRDSIASQKRHGESGNIVAAKSTKRKAAVAVPGQPVISQPRLLATRDQVVPTSGADILATEEQVLKELQEIEGMLTDMFEDNASPPPPLMPRSADKNGGTSGGSFSVRLPDTSMTGKSSQSKATSPTRTRECDSDSGHCASLPSQDLEWESLLGDINQIEGKSIIQWNL